MDLLVFSVAPFDIIVRDPAMESMEGIMDLGNGVVWLTKGTKPVELPLLAKNTEPKRAHNDTGREEFTSESSAEPSSDEDEDEDKKEDEELVLMMRNDENVARGIENGPIVTKPLNVIFSGPSGEVQTTEKLVNEEAEHVEHPPRS